MTTFKEAALGPHGVDRLSAIIMLVCSIIFPGFTQIFYGGYVGFDFKYILIGIIMLLTLPILVGFIWSIIWGVLALMKSVKRIEEEREVVENVESTDTKSHASEKV